MAQLTDRGGGGEVVGVVNEDDISWLRRADRGCRYLVGVSGGADSVALLHLLVGAGFKDLVVCHLDHCLRGEESAEDSAFVGRLAEALGLPCEMGRTDVRRLMEETGDSMETAARKARHAFFKDCALKWQCGRVLLGHHADDQAETVLWNLLRGSHGLKGMREEQRLDVEGVELLLVRPLLGVRHGQLVSWLESRDLRWREDASNLEPVAVRNRLRNEVMPLLAEISGRDAAAAFSRAAADAAAVDDLVNGLLDDAMVIDPQGRLHAGVLRKLPRLVQAAAVRRYLVDAGVGEVDRDLIGRALGLLGEVKPAAINLPGGRRLRRSGGRLWIGD